MWKLWLGMYCLLYLQEASPQSLPSRFFFVRDTWSFLAGTGGAFFALESFSNFVPASHPSCAMIPTEKRKEAQRKKNTDREVFPGTASTLALSARTASDPRGTMHYLCVFLM